MLEKSQDNAPTRKKSRKLTLSNTDSLLIPLLPELIEIMDVIALKISLISYQMNKCECFGFEQMYFTQTLGWTKSDQQAICYKVLSVVNVMAKQ